MMTATSRYWDHERCAWVSYQSPASDAPELSAELVPEQRADEDTVPAAPSVR